VAQLAALCGAVADSSGKGADLLHKTAGVRLGKSTVESATEAVGGRIAGAFARGETFGPAADWPWFRDASGMTVAYVSIDATGVPQQGPGGAKADGRMAYVGMVFDPRPDPERVFVGQPRSPPLTRARYVSGLYELAEMGPPTRRRASQVGMDHAEVWVALTDGGSGLESFMGSNFGRVGAVILDFYHAAGYLGKLARATHPQDEEASKALAMRWGRMLKEEGGDVMLAVLECLGPVPGAAWAVVYEEVVGYFRNQRHRMDYPAYLSRGWYIGSGAVESACKTVVNQRLKGAGQRWGEGGSHAVCHVRALYRGEEGQWEAFWDYAPER
jgi:hypothetical protein